MTTTLMGVKIFLIVFSKTLPTLLLTTPLNSVCQHLEKTHKLSWKAEESVIAEKYENEFEHLKISQQLYVIGQCHGDFRDQQQKCIRNTQKYSRRQITAAQ